MYILNVKVILTKYSADWWSVMREWIVEHDSECEIIVNYNDNSECELSEYIWFCTYNKTEVKKRYVHKPIWKQIENISAQNMISYLGPGYQITLSWVELGNQLGPGQLRQIQVL